MFDHRDPSRWISDARTECVTTTYPDIEIQIAICDRLNVKSNSRNRGNDLANLESDGSAFTARICKQRKAYFESVQQSGLSSIVLQPKPISLEFLSCSHQMLPPRGSRLEHFSTYKTQNENSNFLLGPDQRPQTR